MDKQSRLLPFTGLPKLRSGRHGPDSFGCGRNSKPWNRTPSVGVAPFVGPRLPFPSQGSTPNDAGAAFRAATPLASDAAFRAPPPTDGAAFRRSFFPSSPGVKSPLNKSLSTPMNNNYHNQNKNNGQHFKNNSNNNNKVYNSKFDQNSPPVRSSGDDDASSGSSPDDASHAAVAQIEELVSSLARYFDAVKLCYANTVSVAQSFSALMHRDANAANADAAGRFLVAARETGARVINDAQRRKEASAAELAALVEAMTNASTTGEEKDAEARGDLRRKVICQSFCSLMHFHNKLANLSNPADFGKQRPVAQTSYARSDDPLGDSLAENLADIRFPSTSVAGPPSFLKNQRQPSSAKGFQSRNDDELDLVLDILSAGLTRSAPAPNAPSALVPPAPSFIPSSSAPGPAPAPPSTRVLDSVSRLSSSSFWLSSLPSPQLYPTSSLSSSRFHTLPPLAPPPPPSFPHPPPPSSHSSLPRNFMPQSNRRDSSSLGVAGFGNDAADRRPDNPVNVAFPPPPQPLFPGISRPTSVLLSGAATATSAIPSRGANPAPPRFESGPAASSRGGRGGTWPNSTSSRFEADFGRSTADVVGDVLLDQETFDNPSTEKEYLNYIASVQQYLANHQNNNNNNQNPTDAASVAANGGNDAESLFPAESRKGNEYLDFARIHYDGSSSLLSPSSSSIWTRRPDDIDAASAAIAARSRDADDARARSNSLDAAALIGDAFQDGTAPISVDKAIEARRISEISPTMGTLNGFHGSCLSPSSLEKTKTWPPPRAPWAVAPPVFEDPTSLDFSSDFAHLGRKNENGFAESNIWATNPVQF